MAFKTVIATANSLYFHEIGDEPHFMEEEVEEAETPLLPPRNILEMTRYAGKRGYSHVVDDVAKLRRRLTPNRRKAVSRP